MNVIATCPEGHLISFLMIELEKQSEKKTDDIKYSKLTMNFLCKECNKGYACGEVANVSIWSETELSNKAKGMFNKESK